MTAAVPSNSELTYGALTLGASTKYRPHGQHSMTVDYESLTLTLDYPIVVTSGLNDAIDELETKLGIKEADLKLSWDGKDREWKRSAGTGFNHRGTLLKPGDVRDTRETRYYIVRFVVEIPAPAADSGLTGASWRLDTGRGGRPTLTLQGVYTPTSSVTSARGNYLANVEAYITAIKAFVGGGFEGKPASKTEEGNQEDSRLTWSRVYEGIIFPQGIAGLDVPQLVDPQLTLTITELGGDGTPAGDITAPPIRAEISYSAGVDSSVAATYPQGIWVSLVRPYLLAVIEQHLEVSALALIEDSPESGLRDSELRGRFVCEGYVEGKNGIVSYRMTVSKGGRPPERKMPVSDGNPFSAHVYSGPAELQLTITETVEVLGRAGDLFGLEQKLALTEGLSLGAHGRRKTAAELEKLTNTRWLPETLPMTDQTPITRGMAPHTVELVEVSIKQTWTRVDRPSTALRQLTGA